MEGPGTQLHFAKTQVILMEHPSCLSGGADVSPWWEIALSGFVSLRLPSFCVWILHQEQKVPIHAQPSLAWQTTEPTSTPHPAPPFSPPTLVAPLEGTHLLSHCNCWSSFTHNGRTVPASHLKGEPAATHTGGGGGGVRRGTGAGPMILSGVLGM